MSTVPRTLADLAVFWRAQGGVPLGIVGNTAHTVGYHLGKDRIYDGAGPGLGDRDYSVQMSRDKAGLTNNASAIDLGRLNGSLKELRRFSEWLVEQCQADRTTYRDIREVIYSTPDGVYVKRYSGPDNKVYTSLRKTADKIVVVTPGNGDASHYTHTHISFYRDSVARDKRPLFAPYFAGTEIPDTSTPGDAVKSFSVPEARTYAKVKDLAWLYADSSLASSPTNVRLSPARELVYVGIYGAGVRIVAYEPAAGDTNGSSRAMFVRDEDIAGYRVEDTKALTDAAYNDGLAKAQAAVAALPRR